MTRRTLVIALLAGATAAPTIAATAPPTETPQDAVDAIRGVLKRTMKPCRTDWARIDAVGFEGSWKVTVRIRDSRAGKGTARWFIGSGWPVAKNELAKQIAASCSQA